MAPDTITVDEAVRKGNQAARILSDPVVVEAIAAADAQFVREWREATTPAERDAAWNKQAVLAEVITKLEVILSNGEVAKEEAKRTGREDLLL